MARRGLGPRSPRRRGPRSSQPRNGVDAEHTASVRSFLAPNPGPITLSGTRSYVVGGTVAAIIDPGPDIESHLAVLADAVAGARKVTVLLTHAHDDHSAGAASLARAVGTEVHGPGGDHPIEDGQRFATGDGDLVAVSTPGHARRHFCFHLTSNDSVFVGDLILGEGDTTWVGEYSGAVAHYLHSLDRLEALAPRHLHPAHGPTIRDPAQTIARFRNHRLARIDMVRRAVARGHTAAGAITRHVYGELPPEIHAMAMASVEAILDYLSPRE